MDKYNLKRNVIFSRCLAFAEKKVFLAKIVNFARLTILHGVKINMCKKIKNSQKNIDKV